MRAAGYVVGVMLSALGNSAQLNKGIPDFNNNMSNGFQIAAAIKEDIYNADNHSPFPMDLDWTRPDVPCGQNTQ